MSKQHKINLTKVLDNLIYIFMFFLCFILPVIIGIIAYNAILSKLGMT